MSNIHYHKLDILDVQVKPLDYHDISFMSLCVCVGGGGEGGGLSQMETVEYFEIKT